MSLAGVTMMNLRSRSIIRLASRVAGSVALLSVSTERGADLIHGKGLPQAPLVSVI